MDYGLIFYIFFVKLGAYFFFFFVFSASDYMLQNNFHCLLQPPSPSVEVVPDNNVQLSAKTLKKTMNYCLRWCHVSTCYVSILCLPHNTSYARWHVFWVPPFCKQGLMATLFSRKQIRNSRILYSAICTLAASYERSHQNLTSRWVLAWSVQTWISKVIIERWEAFGPSTLRGCRQLGYPWYFKTLSDQKLSFVVGNNFCTSCRHGYRILNQVRHWSRDSALHFRKQEPPGLGSWSKSSPGDRPPIHWNLVPGINNLKEDSAYWDF